MRCTCAVRILSFSPACHNIPRQDLLRSCDLHPDLNAQASTGPWSKARRWLSTAGLRCVRVRPGLPFDWQRAVGHLVLTNDLEIITNLYTLAGRVILFLKCAVGPGLHTERSGVRSLAVVEEYWRLPPQPGDLLCSEFGCVKLYSTIPKVYYVIDTWRILSPAPIIRNPVHPTNLTGLPSHRRSVSGIIRRRKRTLRTGVTVALNGLWICGLWCWDRNGQHQVNCVIVHDEGCLGVGCVSRLAIASMTCVCCWQDRKCIIEYHVTYFNW